MSLLDSLPDLQFLAGGEELQPDDAGHAAALQAREHDQTGGGQLPHAQEPDAQHPGVDQSGGAPVLRKRVAQDPVPGPSGVGMNRPKRSRRIPTPDPPRDGDIDENDPYFRKKVGQLVYTYAEVRNMQLLYT